MRTSKRNKSSLPPARVSFRCHRSSFGGERIAASGVEEDEVEKQTENLELLSYQLN